MGEKLNFKLANLLRRWVDKLSPTIPIDFPDFIALGGFIKPTRNNMIDIEEMAQERAARTVESNPDAKVAEGLLATAIIQGAQIVERPWEHSETFDFGGAISALKLGLKVARKGWNGKGMFLWLKPAASVKSEWCKDPMLKKLAEDNGGEIEALGTICMFTAQHQILSGWLASQTDMLSEDWVIVS